MKHLYLVLLVLCLFPLTLAAKPPSLKLDYDPVQDQLSLHSQEHSLQEILTHIALETGLEILFDSDADGPIALKLEAQSLERGLRQLLADKNAVFIYADAVQHAEPFLLGLRILPAGTEQSQNLRPLLNPVGEAMYHTRSALQQEDSKPARQARELRWQARLERLPDGQRERLLQAAQQRQAAQQQREAEREARKAESEARREQKRLEREARMEELRTNNPEAYAKRQQRIEENRRLRQEQGIGRVTLDVEILDAQ